MKWKCEMRSVLLPHFVRYLKSALWGTFGRLEKGCVTGNQRTFKTALSALTNRHRVFLLQSTQDNSSRPELDRLCTFCTVYSLWKANGWSRRSVKSERSIRARPISGHKAALRSLVEDRRDLQSSVSPSHHITSIHHPPAPSTSLSASHPTDTPLSLLLHSFSHRD